jgi:hypothetical protein
MLNGKLSAAQEMGRLSGSHRRMVRRLTLELVSLVLSGDQKQSQAVARELLPILHPYRREEQDKTA